MHNFCGKKRPAINLNLFTSLSHSFFCLNPTKTPSNFQYGVVGLGIVAAMTDSTHTHQSICFAPSPRSTPIPIVSSVKAAPSFGGGFNSEKFDELSDNDTSVISHFSDNLIKNQFGFGDDNKNCSGFTAAPSPRKNNMGQFKREFWSDGFLTSCHLCSGFGYFHVQEKIRTHDRNSKRKRRNRTGSKACIKPLSLRLYSPPLIFSVQTSSKQINLEDTMKPMTICVLH
ncbi:hypothetical protein ES288_D03G183300v1 [Gossypium darwinii]|uniref:Uncharacterized protein n=1 Tax=Gossypium darwinii TaxID=34276 RepID=A0A5D2DA99_GOSDA|nr:hypothetical protein ES288_D03G183300v1 [Gossypium darwinii]